MSRPSARRAELGCLTVREAHERLDGAVTSLRRLRSGACLVGLAIASIVGPARADEPARGTNDRLLAESLFREAKALFAEGRYAEACPKLEESQRLDPGGGTLMNLALCHEKQGRAASAWAEYREALAVARRDGREDRASDALAHIAALEGVLAHLVVAVEPSGPAGLVVTLDGRPLPAAAWGTPIAVDPGEHVVVATRGDREVFRTIHAVPTGPGEARVLVRESAVSPGPKRAVAPSSAPPSVRTAALGPEGITGVAMLSTGSAATLGGAIAGIFAAVKLAESDAACVHGCTAEGVAASETADTAASVSTALFAVGVPLAGAGLLAWLVAPDTPAIAPWVGPTGAGAALTGRF